MLAFKSALVVLTLAVAMFFGFWELRIKRQMTDDALDREETVSDYSDVSYDMRRDIRRESILRNLPPEPRSRLRVVLSLKLIFVGILIIEVLCFA